jgi:hypothetical protein
MCSSVSNPYSAPSISTDVANHEAATYAESLSPGTPVLLNVLISGSPPPSLPQPPPPSIVIAQSELKDVSDPPTLQDYILIFVTDTIPRQIYLQLLLRLPHLYFSRVYRIFREAELTMGEIKEMALQATAEDNKTFHHQMLNMGYYYHTETTKLSPAYQRLKSGWEHFIDNMMREWKTLNIISVLLLS